MEGGSGSKRVSSTSSNIGGSSKEKELTDIGWKYNRMLDPKNPIAITCNFCGKITNGGIFRAKQHQVGIFKNAAACKKCPEHVKDELLNHMRMKKRHKEIEAYQALQDVDDYGFGDDEDEDEVEEISRPNSKRAGGCLEIREGANVTKRVKGPMDMFFQRKKSIGAKLKQKTINEACDKELRAETVQYIARFWYQAALSFNSANLNSFKDMVEAIGRYGPGLKPPSYHELRVPLLKKEVDHTEQMMKAHKIEWAKNGCSIMSDGWTDKKNRTLINILVNCSLGTMFVESIDASSYMKTGEKIFELLDKFVERIGAENVVQVITDNGSNFKAAGELLMAKRKHLYWTPCAAHCIDLILEDIGKIEKVKRTLSNAIFLTGYIYNHVGVLSMMREFTNNSELVRYGVTRFATTFLSLESLGSKKECIRNMFTSEKWLNSKWAKDAKGKRAYEIVLMPSFWANIVYVRKVMGPLVKVLRLVDNEKKPAMGYIYEAMDRAKEAIQSAFEGRPAKYKKIFEIIDERWECQLHRDLHAAGHYLNPEFFYNDPSIENCEELTSGLYECIDRMIESEDTRLKIMDELHLYKRAQGQFGNNLAIRTRSTKSPAEWWNLFGNSAAQLQKMAIKILSLTCSASGCERNWSMFEHVHNKRRNKLEHQKLHDLIYVKYNQTLKSRYEVSDKIDPISLNDIDACNEWVVGEMGASSDGENEIVHNGGDLTWGVVGEAVGAGQRRATRQQTRSNLHTKSKGSTSSNPPNSIPLPTEEEGIAIGIGLDLTEEDGGVGMSSALSAEDDEFDDDDEEEEAE